MTQPFRSYVNLDALKRLCDGTDTWVGGESQVILPTSTVRSLIEIAEAATVVVDIAKAMNNPAAHTGDDSMFTDTLVGLDASLTALKGKST